MFANTQSNRALGMKTGIFGTNPIAIASSRKDKNLLVIDLPLSKVTKGKIMVVKQKQVSIPKEWAVYLFGQPTTDPEAALSGTMLPMGEAKGATLVLIVEVLSAARTASHFGFEASSSFLLKVLPPRGWPVAYRVCAKAYI